MKAPGNYYSCFLVSDWKKCSILFNRKSKCNAASSLVHNNSMHNNKKKNNITKKIFKPFEKKKEFLSKKVKLSICTFPRLMIFALRANGDIKYALFYVKHDLCDMSLWALPAVCQLGRG